MIAEPAVRSGGDLETPGPAEPCPDPGPGAVAAVLDFLAVRTGLDPTSLGPEHTTRAVARCMRAAGASDPLAYLAMLDRGAAVVEALLEAVLIPETWFFRDGGPFALLGRHAGALRSRPGFRALSLACSTGEEPYSIAMTLLEAGLRPEQIDILAVDIRAGALEIARRGVYGRASVRGAPPAALERHATWRDDELVVSSEVRGMVTFLHGNALDPKLLLAPGIWDAVFCRNLLIYLSPSSRVVIRRRVRDLLGPRGLFFAGHAEPPAVWAPDLVPLREPLAFAFRTAEGA